MLRNDEWTHQRIVNGKLLYAEEIEVLWQGKNPFFREA